VVEFAKSLGEIHDEHVRLMAFLEALGEIVDKLDQLCLTGSVPPETGWLSGRNQTVVERE
jgi:hypothetical protein